MFCSECGKKINADEALYCPKCGAIVCQTCGEESEEVCPYCSKSNLQLYN